MNGDGVPSIPQAPNPVVIRLVTLLIVATAAVLLWEVVVGPAYIVPLTDFGRDLMGADAARAGLNPYQTVGDLIDQLPGWDLMPEANDHWIAHPPFAIGIAGLWSAVFGTQSEVAFRLASWFAVGFVLTWLGLYTTAKFSRWGGIAVAAAASMSFGLAPEIWYLNGASLAALGLIGVFELEGRRRTLALILLGGLIAWRPWLVPVAFFLPSRKALWRDLLISGSTAVALTLFSVWWLGGYSVLWQWLDVALPGNFAHVQYWPLNMSITGSVVPAALGSLVFLAVTLTLCAFSRLANRRRWWLLAVAVILIGSPLVWPQYWFNLTPLIVMGMGASSLTTLLLALLLVSKGVAGVSASVGQLAVVAFCVLALFIAFGGSRTWRRLSTDNSKAADISTRFGL